MCAGCIERVGAHAVEPPVLAGCVEHTQERRLRYVAAFEMEGLEGAVGSYDAADGVNAGVGHVAVADIEGHEAGVVCESVNEMTGAVVCQAAGSDVEVLQALCRG